MSKENQLADLSVGKWFPRNQVEAIVLAVQNPLSGRKPPFIDIRANSHESVPEACRQLFARCSKAQRFSTDVIACGDAGELLEHHFVADAIHSLFLALANGQEQTKDVRRKLLPVAFQGKQSA